MLLDLEFAEARLWVAQPYGYTGLFAKVLDGGPSEVEAAVIRVFEQNVSRFAEDPESFLQAMQNGLRQRLPDENEADRIVERVPRRRSWLRLRNRPSLGSADLLLRMLEGHTSAVNSLAVGETRGAVVGGSEDHTVKIWDLETGALRHTLEGHTDKVTSVAVDERLGRVVSGSDDHTVKIWDLETFELLRTLRPNRGTDCGPDTDPVKCVAVDSARGVVVAIHSNRITISWNSNPGRHTMTLWLLGLCAFCIFCIHAYSYIYVTVPFPFPFPFPYTFVLDLTLLLLILNTIFVVVRHASRDETLEADKERVVSVAVDSTRGLAVSSSFDVFKVWDLRRKSLRCSMDRRANGFALGRMGRVLVTTDGSAVRVWDWASFVDRPPARIWGRWKRALWWRLLLPVIWVKQRLKKREGVLERCWWRSASEKHGLGAGGVTASTFWIWDLKTGEVICEKESAEDIPSIFGEIDSRLGRIRITYWSDGGPQQWDFELVRKIGDSQS